MEDRDLYGFAMGGVLALTAFLVFEGDVPGGGWTGPGIVVVAMIAFGEFAVRRARQVEGGTPARRGPVKADDPRPRASFFDRLRQRRPQAAMPTSGTAVTAPVPPPARTTPAPTRAMSTVPDQEAPRLRAKIATLEAIIEDGARERAELRARLADRETVASSPAPRSRPPTTGTAEAQVPETRDAVVLMVGGEPREHARVRLERSLELQELEWIADDPRKVDAAVDRITSRRYTMVLVLNRFVSHPSSERLRAAATGNGVLWACVERGYGVNAVRQSLRRFLTGSG